MSKLSKAQFKAHNAAEDLLKKETLALDEREFVLRNWDPSAQHVNSSAGAFFTPYDLANSFAVMLGAPDSIIDLCAGIGALSFAATPVYGPAPKIVCIEKNPDYVRVGRKIVPHATWIDADVFDVLGMELGQFEAAIGNPPFGRVDRAGKKAPTVTGADFEYHVIAIGMGMAEYGQFIVPQMSAGFTYSGKPHYERNKDGKAFDFQEAQGLHFECCSIDTDFARREWKGTAPVCEVVSVHRVELEMEPKAGPAPVEHAQPQDQPAVAQLSLFEDAA